MKGSIFYFNGAALILFALIFSIAATKGYGNHVLPQTTPEAITDLITAIIALTGFVLVTVSYALPKNNP